MSVRECLLIVMCCSFTEVLSQGVGEAWVARYDGPASRRGADGDIAQAIAVDDSGNVYVTGQSADSVTGSDYATIKYFPNGDTAWVRSYNGPDSLNDVASALVFDDSGQVYVTGYSATPSLPGLDYATIKYYPNGDTAWVRRYDGPANSTDRAYTIAVDDSGNVYVTGPSQGGVGLTLFDYATLKYLPSGDTAWLRRYNGPDSLHDYAYALAVDISGNVYVTGESQLDYATIKYYPNGDTAWVRRYDSGDADYGYALAINDSGNVYVTGKSGITGTQDYVTINYHPNGDTAWVRRYNGLGNGFDEPRDIAVDDSGNVYVTGTSVGSGSNYDYATIKYYPNGDTGWVRRYNGLGNDADEANALAVDDSGNVYVTGFSYGSSSNDDYVTIKYSPSGDSVWVKRYNGPGNSGDQSNALDLDDSGNVYVTGQSVGDTTGNDYTTIKYSPCSAGPDFDGDSVADTCDNCDTVGNSNQADADVDNVGDACDICPTAYNPLQQNAKPGDANASNDHSLADAIAIVNYVFNKPVCSPTPLCWLSNLLCRGDWNGSTSVTLSDVIRAVNYIFNKPGGPWNAVPVGVCCL